MKPASATRSTRLPPQGRIAAAAKAGAVRLRDDLMAGMPACRRPLRALRLRAVADDEHDLGGIGGGRRGFDQRLQIRAAPRDQHADPELATSLPPRSPPAAALQPGLDGVAAGTAL